MTHTAHKFNDVVRKRILQALGVGSTMAQAAEFGGISSRTLGRWLDRGRKGESDEYEAFLHEVNTAKATMIVSNLANINRAAQSGTWQASAWLLERRDPANYGRTTREYAQARDALSEASRGDDPNPATMTDAEVEEEIRRRTGGGSADGAA